MSYTIAEMALYLLFTFLTRSLLHVLYCRERALKFEEGNKLREADAKEMAKLAALKEQIVKSLESKGIDATYMHEMRALDISKLIRR